MTYATPLEVSGPDRQEMRLSDGTQLVADIWRPAGAGTFPVLLMRQPYGRAIASTVTLAHPAWYAAQGYLVVVQDVRGTGASEGAFDALVNEAADGAETLNWARDLSGSNGRIGTYGFSYQGMTQFMTLAGGARPDAMALAMAPWDPMADWASEAGLFRAAMSTGWAAQMARLKARRLGDMAALGALDPALGWQRHFEFLVARPDLSHLARWAAGDAGSMPAAALSPPPAVPLLQTAGTCDFLLRGALASDAVFRAANPDMTHLILGPWAHIGWNRRAGAARLGPAAEFSVDRAQLAFFDHYLKGQGPRPAACHAYDGGTDRWAEADPARLAHAPSTGWALSSTGLAATLLNDGRLGDATASVPDHIVHDPTRPAPLAGGAIGTPVGPVDLAAIHDGTDVACYTSAPVSAPLHLFGPARADMSVQVSGDHPAMAASLSKVLPDGRAIALATAIATPNDGQARFRFDALSHTLCPGAALRLSLQAAPYPDFLPYPANRIPDPGVTATTFRIDTGASRLFLPIDDKVPSHA